MANTFEELINQILANVDSILNSLSLDFDKSSYIQLVECLKYQDSIAVKDAAEGLVQEGNPLAIPPLYLASQKHPSRLARQHCEAALQKLDTKKEVQDLVSNKEIEEAVKVLVDKYGRYND